MMDRFSRSLDEQIRQAMLDGAFDDLPGKGKPLDLSENPHEDPGWRMAYRMLRSNGFSLPWIETRRAIEADFEGAQKILARSWDWRQTALDRNYPYAEVEDEWQRALASFEDVIAGLNKRILNYNLEVPLDQFKRRHFNLEREISKITNPSD
jgi:DnaJ family protein C protein 28